MNNQTYEALRQVIITQIPEIMELKFGCKILDLKHQFFGKNQPEIMTIVYGSPEHAEDDGFDLLHYRGNPVVHFSLADIQDSNKCKIIGRPITLPDMMLTFKKLVIYAEINSDGSLDAKTETGIKYCNWDFVKTLEDQSDECKQFLADLLIPTK